MKAANWKPISTAPTDGRALKVRYDDGSEEDGVYFAATRYCMLGAPAGSRGPGFLSPEAGHLPVNPVEWLTHPDHLTTLEEVE
jgi:hypothetical protein